MSEERFSIEYTTKSGFLLEITPLPPYYGDIIDDLYPLKEYPKRVIELLAGDIVTKDYELPEEEPAEDDEDFHLWLKWHEAEEYNKKLERTKNRARRDLLLSLCVEVKKGPIDFDNDDWLDKIEAPFIDINFQVPEHRGQAMLMFIKYIVLTDQQDVDIVMQGAMFQEVTLEGIGHALQNFRSNMGRAASDGSDNKRQEESAGP